MPTTPDPKLLEQARALGPLIAKHAADGERDGRLARPVLDALRDAGFTRLLLPRSLGGHEVDPVTLAAVSAEVARHDAPAAWAIMVSNQSAFSASGFPDATVEEIFRPRTIVAGIIAPPFMATPAAGGYKLSGRHPFASIVRDADWPLATGLVPRPDGAPEVVLAVLPKSDVTIHETWGGALGMRATDTQDVEIRDAFVPKARAFSLIAPPTHNRHYHGALYRFPVAGACVAAVIAPVALGVAEGAVAEMRRVFDDKMAFGSQTKLKERPEAQAKLGRAEALVRASRAYLFDALGRAWERTRAGHEATLEEKADLVLAASHAAQSSAQAVDVAYSATGTTGVFAGRRMGRLLRDSLVLRQHGFTAEGRYATGAQMILGLAPDVALLAG